MPILKVKELPAGLVIDDRYKIIKLIGVGGFAAVYESEQLKMDRRVAVKVLNFFGPREGKPSDKRHQTSRERFIREAKVMAGLKHTGVVSVHDFGFIEGLGQPYIVMELLQGATLGTLLEAGPLGAARSLKIVTRCLEALTEAHSKGIIHRDLKPTNIFIINPGEGNEDVRILDFGIASISQNNDDRLTESGQLVGTYRYLSPEYIKGRQTLPALDVYQMGLILAEAIMGSPMVEDGNQFVTLMKHVEGRIELPLPLLASPLGPVFSRALQPDHRLRYPDAASFLADLSKIDPADIPDEGLEEAETAKVTTVDPDPAQTSAPATITETQPTFEALPQIVVPQRQPTADFTPRPEIAPPVGPHKRSGTVKLLSSAVVALVLAIAALITWHFSTQPEPATTAPEHRTATLKSEPSGAMILEGKTVLGKTPMKFSFGADQVKVVTVELRLAGHKSTSVTIEPSSGPVHLVKLEKE